MTVKPRGINANAANWRRFKCVSELEEGEVITGTI